MGGFRHEALLYSGQDDFLAVAVPFVLDALAERVPVFVAVTAANLSALRSRLGPVDGRVQFADMNEAGRNPAWIIPLWREFFEKHGGLGQRVRGIGEPIWAGRSHAELDECHRHEELINVAFAETVDAWLLCPYDTRTLPPGVIDKACERHPFVCEGRVHRASDTYLGIDEMAAPCRIPLPAPPQNAEMLGFAWGSLSEIRHLVHTRAAQAGLDDARTRDLVLAVNEAVANSIRHGGGAGTLRIWHDDDVVSCEVTDHGRITDPLLGRVHPAPDALEGRGLWLINQTCDLVQQRSVPDGNAVRMTMRRSSTT